MDTKARVKKESTIGVGNFFVVVQKNVLLLQRM